MADNKENGRRLIGWKSIGHFLGCTGRTAMRWETDRGLPVHRVPGGSRSSVWANPEQLNTWLAALPQELRGSLRPERLAVSPRPGPKWLPATPLLVLLVLLVTGLAAWRFSSAGLHLPIRTGTAYDDDPAARETYLTARFEFNTRTANSLAAAERDFQQLIARYPDRASGWSGLADTYILLREFGQLPDDEALSQAARAARTALALDSTLPDAWLDQGYVAWWWHGDAPTAFPAFERALELDPNSVRAWHWYATALETHGEFGKSLDAIAKARALEPGNRAIVADEALIRFDSGQRAQGLATLERLVQLDPTFMSWHMYLSHAYIALGRDGDFLREALIAAQLRNQPDVVAGLHRAEARFREAGRQAMLEELTADEAQRMELGRGYAVYAAEFRALANDREGMERWLKVADQRHEGKLILLRSNPAFASYRDDPIVQKILAQMP